MTTKTYTIPPAFYEDHRARDCGETGRVVRETKRQVIVELDAEAYADLKSDAELFLFNFEAGQYELESIGMRSSAAATLRSLAKDPFSDEELAADKLRREQEWEDGREAREAEQARFRAELEARRLEREAELAAHPRLRVEYWTPRLVGHVIAGLESNENLKVGAILRTETLAEYEILELGEIDRGGRVNARVQNRFHDEELRVRLELGRIYR